jgi:hypothetical protein
MRALYRVVPKRPRNESSLFALSLVQLESCAIYILFIDTFLHGIIPHKPEPIFGWVRFLSCVTVS